MTNEDNPFSMMVILGSFLLLLGVLMDDGSTLILVLKGYGILESNPVAQSFGIITMFASNMIIYIFMLTGFWWVTRMYKRYYKQKAKGYKLYDLFIFMFCMVIVTMSLIKIEEGLNNLESLRDTSLLDQQAEQYNDLIKTQPNTYHAIMSDNYQKGIYNGISYLQLIFHSVLAFLLFKVDHRVEPWNLI